MWEQIRANRRRSIVMIVVVATILLSLGAIIGLYFGPAFEAAGHYHSGSREADWESSGINSTAGLVGAVIALGVFIVLWVVAVAGGDDILLGSANAREVQHADAAQLYNIVEEMTIAAGLPKPPRVYIIDSDAPNAFSVGTPEKSVVAVTSGLLMHLNRDELQGVVGHEIGHIRNEDTRFMTLAGVMMGAIILIADGFGRMVFYSGSGQRRSSSRDSGGAQAILFIIAILFAILAPILAQLFYFACSRRREYMADASSATFTRYPEGLASALEKIERSAGLMTGVNRAVAPMYVVNPLQAAGTTLSLFSTHPPTADRVRILRSMAGAGLGDYEKAYSKAQGEGLLGSVTLSDAAAVAPRSPSAAAEKEPLQKARQAVDLLHQADGFIFVPCACGLKLKVPPNFAGQTVRCPRCGTEHEVPAQTAASE
jgi:heat shock protein HtpX